MVRHRPAVILMRAGREHPAFTTALTPDACTISAESHQVASLATSILAGFSADYKYTPVILSKVKRQAERGRRIPVRCLKILRREIPRLRSASLGMTFIEECAAAHLRPRALRLSS